MLTMSLTRIIFAAAASSEHQRRTQQLRKGATAQPPWGEVRVRDSGPLPTS